MRLGILGGAFDPVHIGHVLVAQDVQEKLKLDRVMFLPAAHPPHKHTILPYAPRRDMLKAAIRSYPGFELCELEAHNNGPSYTIDTLVQLHQQHPRDSLFLLLGLDQFAELNTWKEPWRLGEFAEAVVLARPCPNHARLNLRESERITAARHLTTRLVEVSSSEIRQRIQQGLPIQDLVPEPALKLIEKYRLYQTERPLGDWPAEDSKPRDGNHKTA